VDKNFTQKFYSMVPNALFEDASTGTNGKKTDELSEFDSPRAGPPVNWNGQQLTGINLVWDFRLFVVALTKDTRNAANGSYVGQSMATWKFNGTGTTPNGAPLYAWQPNGAAVTPPTGWGAPDTNPKTDGDRFNNVLNTIGWQ